MNQTDSSASSDSKIGTEQILSVKNLSGFGTDNFSDFKFGDDKKSGDKSDSEVTESDSSEVTARVGDRNTDSDTFDTSSNASSDDIAVSDDDSSPQVPRVVISDRILPSSDSTKSCQENVISLPPHPQQTKSSAGGRRRGSVTSLPRSSSSLSFSPDGDEQISTDTGGSPGKILNYDHVDNSDNFNGAVAQSINSTMVQDENSKYFTIIHDVPKGGGGPCKKCPKMQLMGIKEWWKVQQNLSPRSRHSIRVALIAIGSALLLLTIFLLARLPSSPKDVLNPFMYDLPPDDYFRPNGRLPDGDYLANPHTLQNVAPLPPHQIREHDFHESYEPHPKPVALQSLKKKLARVGGGVDPSSLDELEISRRAKMVSLGGNMSFAEKAGKVALDLVRETVEMERKTMQNKEASIWSEGATPLRILLVSTWRSGSTFLGQVLQQHPGVFQHYEPFSYMGVKQIRSGTEAFQSQQLLHRLLECRFKDQDQYLNYTKEHPVDMSGHNKRIWKPCNFNTFQDICSNATFLTESCNMFPIQLVKTVRLRLNLTQLFLGETRLNAKVVFLVRDPRATMNSRRSSVDWCDNSEDCSSPEVLCSDLKDDLKVSAAFERLFPNSFIRVRYEDLANNPQKEIKNLLDFLGMEFTKELEEFVKSHTETDSNSPWTIARKSAARVSRWKENLPADEIAHIEKICRPVLEKLNYEIDEK